MLTIREPISIKCGRPMFSSHKSFAEKIIGNYELIPASVEREDLLHLVTMPPEVYIESGGGSSILTDTRTTNIRETKIDVINNLLNRIALTEEVDLTYQDRAFITDVLEKLGVSDVSLFMNELTSMKQEVKDVRQLTRLYQNSLSQIHQTLEGFEETQNIVRNVEQNYEGGQRITLHEDIMKRLQTEDVYQDLYNFYILPAAAQERPAGERLMLSEQERILSQLRLNTLETRAAGESVPLIYRYENSYVDQDVEEETYSQITAENRIAQALLLDMANDLYVYMTEAAPGREDNWVNAENIFYQAAENTLQRLSLRVEEPALYFPERTQSISERLERYERETSGINELLTLRQLPAEQILAPVLTEEAVAEAGQGTGKGLQPLRLTYQEAAESEETAKEESPAKVSENHAGAPVQSEFSRIMNVYLSQLFPVRQVRAYTPETATAPREQKAETITTVQTESVRGEEVQTQPIPQAGLELEYLTALEEETENETEEEVSQTAEERIPGETPQEAARRISSSRERQSIQQREINTFVQGDTYNTANAQTQEEISISYTENEGSPEAPQETNPAEPSEEEILREVEEINRQNEETYRRIQEISRQQTSKRPPAVRREGSPLSLTREESLRALEHPEEVLMEHRMRQSEEETNAAAAQEALLEILPPETIELMEQLGEMQQRRRSDETGGGIEQDNNMQQLLLDIREVEEENRTEEQRISENRRQTEKVSETVLEERREYESPAQTARTRTEREYETVSLVHRTLENSLDEEEIADIVARSQVVQHETEQIIRTEENTQRQQVQQQVNVTQTNLQHTEDINEVVQQAIRQQMGAMSDEIYGQMERRLDRERKRRGY